MPGVTKEQIQAAREADLFTYLQFHEPGVLKQDGPNFRHKEHDSLVYVTGKRYWYWNSRGRSINALDYLIQIRGYGLVDAVHALVGGEIPQEPAYRSTAEIQVSKEPEKKTFALPWARRCATAAVSYLQKRGISSEVIRQCLQAGIFYEARYHGEPVCVFVGKDDSGKAKFACMRSISGVSSGAELAKYALNSLSYSDDTAEREERESLELYCTDSVELFSENVERFLGNNINAQISKCSLKL